VIKKTTLVLLLVCVPLVASAQLKSQENGLDMRKLLQFGVNPIGVFSNSFLDPDKFHMSQSYSFGVSSFGGSSMNQAMYLNTMSYQISNPLSVSLQWGYMMNQSMGGGENKAFGFNNGLPFNNGFFISGAQLRYTPSENTELRIEFRQMPYNPYSYNPYSNYGSPFNFREDREF
jgi:hypothetical protein